MSLLSQVTLGRTLGEGMFGAVVEGKWRGARVAVKRLKAAAFTNTATTLADFRAEVGVAMTKYHIVRLSQSTQLESTILCLCFRRQVE